jgi:hypothetical protein
VKHGKGQVAKGTNMNKYNKYNKVGAGVAAFDS